MKAEIGFWIGVAGFILASVSIVLSALLYLFSNARANLIQEIHEVLQTCRNCALWDDRSEMKLFQYIGAEENRLGRYGIKALVEVRNRAYEYWKVHLEMDNRGDEYPYRVPFCTWRQFLRYELFGSRTDEFVP